ncbi:MAG: hypothetical protein KJ052_06710 [Candidatus Hydrogenedentes bacterium]|nr:hypothetical protein [Candidatus Hydrogenedentota bacterium]
MSNSREFTIGQARLGVLWAASCSWIGHLLGRLGRSHGAYSAVETDDGVIEYRHNGLLEWLPRQPAAIVFGNVVNYATNIDPESIMRRYDGTGYVQLREHELVHVRQYRCWGPFFLPAYFLAELVAVIKLGRGVNAFEQHADDQSARQEFARKNLR